MQALTEFLAVARSENVQEVRFGWADNGQFKVTLRATLNDRKYEAVEVAAEVDLAAKGALYQWVEGMRTNPPTADVPKADAKPNASGGYQCGECGDAIPERVAKGSPPNTCRDAKCIQAYWGKRATLRRGYRG